MRRYQNADGSLTAEGRDHYAKYTKFAEKRLSKSPLLSYNVAAAKAYGNAVKTNTKAQRKMARVQRKIENSPSLKLLAKISVNRLQNQIDTKYKTSKDRKKARSTFNSTLVDETLNMTTHQHMMMQQQFINQQSMHNMMTAHAMTMNAAGAHFPIY